MMIMMKIKTILMICMDKLIFMDSTIINNKITIKTEKIKIKEENQRTKYTNKLYKNRKCINVTGNNNINKILMPLFS